MSDEGRDSMIERAESIYIQLNDELVVIKESEHQRVVRRTGEDPESGKKEKVKVTFADALSKARSDFGIWHDEKSEAGQLYRYNSAALLVRIYEWGQTWGLYEKGEAYIPRLDEAERLAKKLAEEIVSLTIERDAWKKRYDDCETSKFGAGAFTSNVEESR